MNACWHDGKVYCGKTPSPDRIIGYYDEKTFNIDCYDKYSIGSLSVENVHLDIWFSTVGIWTDMVEMKKHSTVDSDMKVLAWILNTNANLKQILDRQTSTQVADYQGDSFGACAAFVCLIYQKHLGVIDSKYSRFYTDYINSFH